MDNYYIEINVSHEDTNKSEALLHSRRKCKYVGLQTTLEQLIILIFFLFYFEKFSVIY